MTKQHPLVRTAEMHVRNLKDKPNRFGLGKITINANEAFTSCSTFHGAMLLHTYDVDPAVFRALFGSRYPRARSFQQTYSAGNVFPAATKLADIQPGTVGAIGYEEDRDGMSGHCLIVVEKPRPTGAVWGADREYSVRVVDSCKSSHGEDDTRWNGKVGTGGVGMGNMRILVSNNDSIVAHSWSVSFDSQVVYNGDGLELAFANIPSNWSPR